MPNTQLTFLEGKRNVYYAGLDDKAFPFGEAKRRIKASFLEQLRYIKILALLVDHIAIPPTFIVSAMNRPDSSEVIKSYLLDLFKEKVVLTSIYSSMFETKDFIDFKILEGSPDEKIIFLKNKAQATDLFNQIPLLHRYIPAMSYGFRSRLVDNLVAISPLILKDEIKEQIIEQIDMTEASGEISLSREIYLNILSRFPLPLRSYRACYYAMNAAYYLLGAQTYFSDISCLNVEEFSVLGRSMFDEEEHKILIAYDPSLFLHVLLCHNISINNIDALDINNLIILRSSYEFRLFKELYFKMCNLIQKLALMKSNVSLNKIQMIKGELAKEIQKKYHIESKRLSKWLLAEDFGMSIILGGLGFALGGPAGATVGAILGLIPPILKRFDTSPAERILNKLKQRNYNFYFYLDLIESKLSKIEIEEK